MHKCFLLAYVIEQNQNCRLHINLINIFFSFYKKILIYVIRYNKKNSFDIRIFFWYIQIWILQTTRSFYIHIFFSCQEQELSIVSIVFSKRLTFFFISFFFLHILWIVWNTYIWQRNTAETVMHVCRGKVNCRSHLHS